MTSQRFNAREKAIANLKQIGFTFTLHDPQLNADFFGGRKEDFEILMVFFGANKFLYFVDDETKSDESDYSDIPRLAAIRSVLIQQ